MLYSIGLTIKQATGLPVPDLSRDGSNCEQIGIATGQLIAGYMGSSQTLSYTVQGRSVNLSARLCGMADPGEVLLGPQTYETVKSQVEGTFLDPIKLKGIATPVSPIRVTNLLV